MNSEDHDGIPRLMWESDHEWRLRTLFLDSNKTEYSSDRLAALSMSWANWKFMGCSYGEEVQSVLEGCHERCPPEVDEEINRIREMAMPKVKFVKSSSESLGTRTGAPSGKGGKVPVDNQDKIIHIKKRKVDYINGRTTKKELVPGFILHFPPIDDIEANTKIIPICLIHSSAQKCRCGIEYIEGKPIANKLGFSYPTSIYINNVLVTCGYGETKKLSKQDCANKAFDILKLCQPIIYKEKVSHDHIDVVDKSKLVHQTYNNAEKIKEDNVGNRLLRKMGWLGQGGVGKSGDGIAEPVFVDAADGRKGVGHVEVDQTVQRRSVDDMLKTFLSNPDQDSIKFSSDLTSQDRAVVHKLCQRYHLKHKSFGKNEDRYLVVSRN